MQYHHATTQADADRILAECRAQGLRAYRIEYRADWFEIRAWN